MRTISHHISMSRPGRRGCGGMGVEMYSRPTYQVCIQLLWPLSGVEVSALMTDRLVGLVVKASASRAEDPGFESHLRRDFSGVE